SRKDAKAQRKAAKRNLSSSLRLCGSATWCDTERKFVTRHATPFLRFSNNSTGITFAPAHWTIQGDKMKIKKTLQTCVSFTTLLLITLCAGIVKAQEIIPTPNCERTIKADVVAFDQPFFYNRLGAVNPAGMIYALRRDVKV